MNPILENLTRIAASLSRLKDTAEQVRSLDKESDGYPAALLRLADMLEACRQSVSEASKTDTASYGLTVAISYQNSISRIEQALSEWEAQSGTRPVPPEDITPLLNLLNTEIRILTGKI